MYQEQSYACPNLSGYLEPGKILPSNEETGHRFLVFVYGFVKEGLLTAAGTDRRPAIHIAAVPDLSNKTIERCVIG